MFGLVTGIAVIAVLGFFVLLVMNLSNKTGDTKVAGDDNQQIQPTTGNEQNSPVDIQITSSDHIRGNPDAAVTIVEFSDFQCPYCQNFHNTLNQLMDDYPNDVRWVYKHFPLDSIHSMARTAAEASECAAEQGKFWEFTDRTFELSSLTRTSIDNIASQIGLDADQFSSCVDNRKYKDKVETDYQLGIQSGVRGTPGNIINGQLVSGALPIEQMTSIVEQILAK